MKIAAATLAGGRHNQDAYAVMANAAVVLDGASSFTPTADSRDVSWYTGHLLAELASRVTDAAVPLPECLRDAVTIMRDVHGASAGGPSTTVLIARWNSDIIELLVLGDSTVVIQHQAGSFETLTDRRIAGIAPDARQRYRSRLSSGHGMDDDHRRILTEIQDAQRRHRNQAGGYWIAEADPAAADHALLRTVSVSDAAAILLATDGAAVAVEDYGNPGTWHKYFAEASKSPGLLLDDTFRLEETDPLAQRWPRSKRHDDKTVVLLQPQVLHPSGASSPQGCGA